MSLGLIVGIGLLGGVFSIARFLLDGAVAGRVGRSSFPWGTLAVNLTGAFLLGVLVAANLGADALRLGADRGPRVLHHLQHLGAGEPPARRGRPAPPRHRELPHQPRARRQRRLARARARSGAVNDDSLKLTIYYGERDRADGGFLADALTDVFARHQLQTSLVIRGIAGFGAKQHVRTDRLLSLSEDLPLVSVAVDTRQRIQAALAEIDALRFDGLVTLERARMLAGRLTAVELPEDLDEATKLTIYVGRGQRAGSRPAYEAVVDVLHRHGVAGATVLLGVDGTTHGTRQRARFFAANADVPLMVISVGDGQQIAAALPELDGCCPDRSRRSSAYASASATDSESRLPRHLPETDASGLQMWQKLMVYASEQSRTDGGPLYIGAPPPIARSRRGRRHEPSRHLGLPRRPHSRTATPSGSSAAASPCSPSSSTPPPTSNAGSPSSTN